MYKILYILRKLLGKMDLSPKDHGINEGSFDDLIKGLTNPQEEVGNTHCISSLNASYMHSVCIQMTLSGSIPNGLLLRT